MRKRLIGIFLICFILGLGCQSVFGRAASEDYTAVEYKVDNKISGEAMTVTAMESLKKNKEGEAVVLLPVKEVVESSGYAMEECPRCGKDELYNKSDDVDEKGHYYVNWYQAILSFSNSDETVELSAENEKIEGVTYAPVDLYEAIGLTVAVNQKKKTVTLSTDEIPIVYFFSSTCDSCEKIEKMMEGLVKKYPSLKIKKYDIFDTANYDLLQEYGKSYQLPDEKVGFTPSVYIGNEVLIGAEIQSKLEDKIKEYDKGPATTVLVEKKPAAFTGSAISGDGYQMKEKTLKGSLIEIGAAFGAGFINGFNPCGLSMFLFLLSLLLVSREQFIRCGAGFLAGKVVMFYLLGTILFRVVGEVGRAGFSRWLDVFMIAFAVIFAVLNIMDFFKARKEDYGGMTLQLPGRFKKFNHTMMKWGNHFVAARYGVLIMFGIGMVVAMGEFLCTGQIYLSSIVIMVQRGSGILPRVLLAVYSIAFVVPLIILMIVVYVGKKVFGASEFVMEKIPWIKLISAMLFVAMAVYVVVSRL